MEEEKNIVIYSRKSRFTGKGESVENQVEMCRRYISLHFGEEASARAKVYEDEGFSGSNLERPQFKQMMADAQKGRFSAVVVYRLDRISRNIGDFAGLIQKLKEMNVDFISIKEQFDTSSPMGRAMMFISSVFSQLERETIAERIRDNMNELAKTGRWLGGVTPTGYCSEAFSYKAKDGKIKRACRLKLLPDEGQTVRMIFQTFIETGSLAKTEEILMEQKIHTKTGINFSRFSIKAILSNPVYMAADEKAWEYFSERGAQVYPGKDGFDGTRGVMVYNRSIQQQGKTSRIRPIDQWIVAAGSHEAAVDGETWIKVQKMLSRNSSKSYKKPRSSHALLSGIIVCGNCGSYMRPKATGKRNKRGEVQFVYLCRKKERSKGKGCRMKNADGNSVDEEVLMALSGLREDKKEFFACMERGRKRFRIEGGTKDKDKKRKDVERQIKNLTDILAEEEDRECRSCLLEELDSLCKKRKDLENKDPDRKRQERSEAELWGDMSPFLTDKSFQASLEEKRMAVRSLTEKVVWDGENIHIVLIGGNMEKDDKKPRES